MMRTHLCIYIYISQKKENVLKFVFMRIKEISYSRHLNITLNVESILFFVFVFETLVGLAFKTLS